MAKGKCGLRIVGWFAALLTVNAASKVGILLQTSVDSWDMNLLELQVVNTVVGLVALQHCQDRNPLVTNALSNMELKACAGLEFTWQVAYTPEYTAETVRRIISNRSQTDMIVGGANIPSIVSAQTAAIAMDLPWVSSAQTSGSQGAKVAHTTPATRNIGVAVADLLVALNITMVGVLIDYKYDNYFIDSLLESASAKGISTYSQSVYYESGTRNEYIGVREMNQLKLNVVIIYGVYYTWDVIEALEGNTNSTQEKLYIVVGELDWRNCSTRFGAEKASELAERVINLQYSSEPSTIERFANVWDTEFPKYNATLLQRLSLPEDFFNTFRDLGLSVGPFMYDAVVTSCRVLCDTVTNSPVTPGGANSSDLMQNLLKAHFFGASGEVAFDSTTQTRPENISSFVLQTLANDFTVRTIGSKQGNGEWDLKRRWIPKIPLAVQYTQDFNYLSPVLKYCCLGLATTLVIFSLVVMCWIWSNRTTKVISRSQPKICIIFLVGVCISTCSLLFVGFEDMQVPREVAAKTVLAFWWFISVGETLICTSLFVKLWRVWIIYSNSRRMKKTIIPNSVLYLTIGLSLSVVVIILVFWTFLAPIECFRVVDKTDVYGNPLNSYTACDSRKKSSKWLKVILIIYIFILFSATAIAAFKVRKVDPNYQESKYIVISLASQAQLYLICLPLYLVFGPSETVPRFVIQFFTVWGCNLMLLLLMFLPKYMSLRHERKETKTKTLQPTNFKVSVNCS
mmetsp:Transcript_28674/g.46305  ORF Transcript_28674/g.46305 Transcript_28674/m.46305 type:complete len:740 (+) Transcript_28674:704-2923(+)